MITLKLGAYNEKERQALAILLSNNLREVRLYGPLRCTQICSECDFRHLCIDLTQAELYAREYQTTK